MELATPFVVVAAAHPSLDDAIQRFGDALRAETRYFGRRANVSTKPTATLIRRLLSREPGITLAAMLDGEVIGVARIDDLAWEGSELLIAVAEPWRRRGVAMALGEAIVLRAHGAGVTRIVLRSSARDADVREVGQALGFEAIDLGRGRPDLVRILQPETRSA